MFMPMLKLLAGRRRRGELDGYVGIHLPRPWVVAVYLVGHRVTPFDGRRLDGMPHLAISYQCYLHDVTLICPYTIKMQR